MLKGNGGEDLIEGFAEAYWTQTMDAIQSGEYADEATIARRGQLESHQMTAEFFSWQNGSKMSEEQRDTFLWILASMPDAMQNAIDKGVSMHDYGSFFGSGALEKINNVWQLLTKAPESVRGVINDPRGQLISLSEMWLRDRGVSRLRVYPKPGA